MITQNKKNNNKTRHDNQVLHNTRLQVLTKKKRFIRIITQTKHHKMF